jgi:ABC-type multidrug transport system permease subunit
MGHPLQMGVTVLVIMALCAFAGVMAAHGNMAWFWGLFFASLFLFAFGVITPASSTYRRSRRYN